MYLAVSPHHLKAGRFLYHFNEVTVNKLSYTSRNSRRWSIRQVISLKEQFNMLWEIQPLTIQQVQILKKKKNKHAHVVSKNLTLIVVHTNCRHKLLSVRSRCCRLVYDPFISLITDARGLKFLGKIWWETQSNTFWKSMKIIPIDFPWFKALRQFSVMLK